MYIYISYEYLTWRARSMRMASSASGVLRLLSPAALIT